MSVLLAQAKKLDAAGKFDEMLTLLDNDEAIAPSADLLALKGKALLAQKKPNWPRIQACGQAIDAADKNNGFGQYLQAQYFLNNPKPNADKALVCLDKARSAKIPAPGASTAYWMLWLKRKWWLFLLLLGGAGAGAKKVIDKRKKAGMVEITIDATAPADGAAPADGTPPADGAAPTAEASTETAAAPSGDGETGSGSSEG